MASTKVRSFRIAHANTVAANQACSLKDASRSVRSLILQCRTRAASVSLGPGEGVAVAAITGLSP